MKKRIIYYLLCICIILSGCGNSSPSTSGNQQDFLNSMAIGIRNRLNESQSVDTDSMGQEERMEYLAEFVTAELTEIEKYSDTVFSDGNFNTLAHLYIDACQMQLAATQNYKNAELYDALWNSGYQARAGIIVALYEKYDLPITAEQADTYRPAYTVTSIVTEEEPMASENSNDSINADITADANLKIIEVEDCWYEFDDEDHFTIYLKIRNKSGMSLGQVLPSIDIIDENGDIVASTAAGFFQVLDDGQGCTIDSDWVESTDAPYGIRISRMSIKDTDGNLEMITINPAYIVEKIPSATSRLAKTEETTPMQPQNDSEQTVSETITSNHTCTVCGVETNLFYKNPILGITEYYCEPHRDHIVDIMNSMMEHKVTQPSQSTQNSNNSSQNSNTSNVGSSARHTDSEAFSCAKAIVKSVLKSPSSAKFCWITDATVTHLGNGEYKVTGWVEAENSYGATLRQNFVVVYTATENGYKNGLATLS